MRALQRISSFALSSTSASALAATALFGGLTLAPMANAQQVLVDGNEVLNSPNVVNSVDLADGEVLTLNPGASIITTGDAVFAAATGSTITVNNDGTMTGGEDGIDATGSTLLLTNSGAISGGGAFSNGIEAGNIIGLNNSGTISGTLAAISAEDGDITGLNNSGTISGGFDGVLAEGDITDLNNSGTISGGDDGIQADGNIANLTNSGTVSGDDEGISAVTGNITGLDNSGTISGGNIGIRALQGDITDLNNSGTISGGFDGVLAEGDITDLNNSGTISGGDDGIQAVGNIANLTNSGTVSGDDEGISAVTGNITGLNNSGNISGGNIGIRASQGDITGLNNSGNISGGFDGILAEGDITGLNNSGTISGNDDGIQADTITSLTNSGTIIGGDFAIQEQGAGDTVLTLQAGSNIQGKIDLGGGTNTLVVGNGLNMVTTFENAPDAIETNGAPVAVQDNGGNTTVAVVDPTGFAVIDNAISDLVSSVSSMFSSRLNESDNSTSLASGAQSIDGTDVSVTPVADLSAQYGGYAGTSASNGSTQNGAWLKAFGGVNEIDGSGPAVDAQHLYGGFAVGIDRRASRDLRLGVFGGIAAGQVEVDGNIQDINTDSYFGGVYGRHDANGLSVDFAVTAGVTEHDSERLVANNQVVGGLETARGDFKGWFVAPEVTFGTEVQGLGHTFKPSLRARYVGMWFDDYTENGSAANLSVDDRDVHTLEARFQLALPLVDNPGRSFELRAGVDGRAILGNDNVDVTLLSQQLEFGPGGKDESLAGFIGASYADRITSNTQVFVSSELGTGTETDINASAQAGVRVNF